MAKKKMFISLLALMIQGGFGLTNLAHSYTPCTLGATSCCEAEGVCTKSESQKNVTCALSISCENHLDQKLVKKDSSQPETQWVFALPLQTSVLTHKGSLKSISFHSWSKFRPGADFPVLFSSLLI